MKSISRKYIPLKSCPLVFKLELVTDPKEPILSQGPTDYAGPTTKYPATLVSETVHLDNFRLRCDLLKLDTTLQNEFDNQFLGNAKSRLSIRFSNYLSQDMSVSASSDLSINMARVLSNLNRVFVSFVKDNAYTRFGCKRITLSIAC